MSLSPTLAAACDDAGRQLAPALDTVSAVLVAGRDVDAAAQVALGAASALAGERRVAIADLGGTAAPLQDLVHDDDLHGLTDIFDFGISVNRVARQVDDSGRVFVIPEGHDSGVRSEFLGDGRWHRLKEDFRDAGALLMVVAPSDTPELERLAGALDGVVAADGAAPTLALPRRLARADVEEVEAAAFRAALAHAGRAAIEPPPQVERPTPQVESAPALPAAAKPRAPADRPVEPPPVARADTKIADEKFADAKVADAKVADARVADAKVADARVADAKVADARVADAEVVDALAVLDGADAAPAAPADAQRRIFRVPTALATVLSVATIMLMVVLGLAVGSASRGDPLFSRGDQLRAGSVERTPAAPGSQTTSPGIASTAAIGGGARAPESATPSSAAPPTPEPAAAAPASATNAGRTASTAGAALPVSNPADTANATAYAVVLGSYADEASAQRHFRDRPRWAAAVTIAPEPADDGSVRYHVVSGADRREDGATSLRASMRGRGALRNPGAPVLRVPYAVQVESGVPIAGGVDSLVRVLNRFLARGFPAYALEESRGRANVYVGAFADPDDARALIARLQAAGLPAALVVRKGRAL